MKTEEYWIELDRLSAVIAAMEILQEITVIKGVDYPLKKSDLYKFVIRSNQNIKRFLIVNDSTTFTITRIDDNIDLNKFNSSLYSIIYNELERDINAARIVIIGLFTQYRNSDWRSENKISDVINEKMFNDCVIPLEWLRCRTDNSTIFKKSQTSELLSETITNLIKSGQLIRVGNKPYKTTATLYRRVK